MDSCHISWDGGVSLAPGRPPDLPLGTWRPLGTLCAVLGLGNRPYLSSSPAQPRAPQGRFYYWRLEQEACTGQVGSHCLLTVDSRRERPEDPGSSAESLKGWIGTEAQRGAGGPGLEPAVASLLLLLPHHQLHSPAGAS